MSTIGSMNRISGLASGLDTDNLVKQLMQAHRIPMNKLSQQKQLLEWRKEGYREITNLLRAFQDDYFNAIKPSNYMVSSSAYKKFTTTVHDSLGQETALLTATGSADASAGSHTITVKALATAAKATSSGTVTDPMVGLGVAATDFTDGNVSFNVTLDGVTKTINLSNRNYGTVNDLITNETDGLNKLLADAFGIDALGTRRITVDQEPPGSGILKFSAPGSKLTVSSAETNDALGKLQFTSGTSNIITTSQTLENLQNQFGTNLTFNAEGKILFKINAQEFSFEKTATLNDLINQVNSSSAGVEIRYSELTDKFSITSKQKGAVNTITLENTEGNFIDALKISTGTKNNGTDAKFTLDGPDEVFRNDNTFTIEGVTYTLSSNITIPSAFTVNLSVDTDAVFNSIKSFVDKYNEVIDKINNTVAQPKYKDFLPLTNEQKEVMSEDQIKQWEEKAKSGLLKNEPLLQKITQKMRSAVFDSIESVSGNLSDIGINTGSYSDKGKLFIDETKLRTAISSNPDKVMNLFSRKSSIDYDPDMTPEERSQRYKEEGIVNRFYDIIRDNIRTSRDSYGKKGFLIEKAGITGDVSEYLNLIDEEIDDTDTRIDKMNEVLIKKEEFYYRQFTALERAIDRMNQQSAWLSQQFGSGQG